MLSEEKKRPGECARGRFKARAEKNGRLTNQLGVGHPAVFIVARLDEERKDIGSFLWIPAALFDQTQNLVLDQLRMLEQARIRRPSERDREQPDRRGKIPARP